MSGEKWARLAEEFKLGALTAEPKRLTGGLMHEMYAITTEEGAYAVKRLNPHIMARPEAKGNMLRAEALEAILERRGLPILAAKTIHGRKMQEFEGQYFYIFNFFPGAALKPEEIAPEHCFRIGEILARIHAVSPQPDGFVQDEMAIDWEKYLKPLNENDPEMECLLRESMESLTRIQERRNKAIKRLPAITAICHGDMDRKNVLWWSGEARVIDLECLSYAQPELELMELLLCWSGLETRTLDAECMRAFLRGYTDAGGKTLSDWATLLDANWDRLYWLRYNVERTLGIGASAEEKTLGRSETKKTLEEVRWIEENREEILKIV